MKTTWRRLAILVMSVVGGMLLLPVACQSKFIYFPRPYGTGTTAEWVTRTKGKIIHFTSSQGPQEAFLQGQLKSPRRLWIVCAGNGSLALDWSEWLLKHAPREDAYLLVDYPGYGASAGSPSPGRIHESFQKCLPAAFAELGWPQGDNAERLRFFGHSLGAAATLIAASDFRIQRGVLVAPFTSTMEMSQVVTGLPLGGLVWIRFDNRARLAELAGNGPGKLIILHGIDDEVIPISMSRRMAAEHPESIRLIEIQGGRHNTIPMDHAPELAAAMAEIGKE